MFTLTKFFSLSYFNLLTFIDSYLNCIWNNFCFLFLAGSCIKGLKLLVSAPSDSVTILFNTWCEIIHTLSYITNLKYKLLRTLRNSSNEEPGNKITQTMEKRTILKEIVIMVMITMIRSILRQMFRVLLREIEDLCSFPHLTFQALQNCKQKGTVWKIRDCCCCLEVSLVCVQYYNSQALFVYYILIWIHMAWIKVLLLAFCHFDTGTSEDQLSFKGISCETSHFGIWGSQIQRSSFYLLKSWGAHWASGEAKDLMPTHTRKFNIWGLGLNSMQG